MFPASHCPMFRDYTVCLLSILTMYCSFRHFTEGRRRMRNTNLLPLSSLGASGKGTAAWVFSRDLWRKKRSLPSYTVAELHVAQPQNCMKLPMDNFFNLSFVVFVSSSVHLQFFFFSSKYQFHPGSPVYFCSYP